MWTPLPCITWLIPPIGHMGISYSTGVIRDFAGPYYVSEDNLAFGKTTRYYQLEPQHVKGKSVGKKCFIIDFFFLQEWIGIEPYTKHQKSTRNECTIFVGEFFRFMTNYDVTIILFSDNCHSHVAMALNLMEYKGRTNWNMVNLCFLLLFRGRFVDFGAFLKTWAPLLVAISIILVMVFTLP